MASASPLLSGTIEADDDTATQSSRPKGNIGSIHTNTHFSKSQTQREAVVLVPGTTPDGTRMGSTEEGGIVRLCHFYNFSKPRSLSSSPSWED